MTASIAKKLRVHLGMQRVSRSSLPIQRIRTVKQLRKSRDIVTESAGSPMSRITRAGANKFAGSVLQTAPVSCVITVEVITMNEINVKAPRILIVDGEPEIVELVKRYAEREGCETVCVYGGAKAREICKK